MYYRRNNNDKELKITQSIREQIYEDIWSTAMYKVAPKYNVSGATLKKRCIKYWDIPVPDTNYWARVHAGKVEIRPALPMPPAESARYYLSEYAVSYIQLNNVPEASLYTSEPLFVFSEKTKELLENTVMDYCVPTGFSKPISDYMFINSIQIEPGTPQHRGVRILYTLSEMVKNFEGESYHENADQAGHLITGVFILCHQNWCYHLDYDKETEKLTLSFYWSLWGFEFNKEIAAYSMRFADRADMPLEQQIGTVFRSLMVESGRKIQEEEIERRNEIIRKVNAERARKLKPYIDKENEEAEKALKETNAYFDAERIRAYAKAYFEKNNSLFNTQPSMKEHYYWLQKRADWLDPLIENDYEQFFATK